MTQRELARLICKALAIWAFLRGLQSLPMIVGPWIELLGELNGLTFGPTKPFGLTPSFYIQQLIAASLPFVAQVGAAWFLWARSDHIAQRMTPDADASDERRTMLVISEEIETAAFSLLGLYTLLQALPELLRLVATLGDPILSQQSPALTNASEISALLQIALGLWLLLGSRGLVRWIRWVGRDRPRHSGLNEESSPKEVP